MNLENKTFTVKDLSVEAIENHIKGEGFEPVRWAIVKAENGEFTIESSCFKA